MSNDSQAFFMDAINGLKELAKVNGNTVTKDDVRNYFMGLELDEGKFQLISGYLMANGIKIEGEDSIDNQFLKIMETSVENEDKEEEADNKVAKEIADNLNYEEDERYLEIYKKDLSYIQPMSDTSRAFLLMNIVEDNDAESLKLLSESYLEKIIEWVVPFRSRGVLAGDLVQEANLCMMAYIGEKQWLNNYEWKMKIKEGTTNDLLWVMSNIDKTVKTNIEESLLLLIDEQQDVNKVSGKILNKVNLVNDWAIRLKEELNRKPTVSEVAQKMGVSVDVINEAIQLSAETIEDIEYEKSKKNN